MLRSEQMLFYELYVDKEHATTLIDDLASQSKYHFNPCGTNSYYARDLRRAEKSALRLNAILKEMEAQGINPRGKPNKKMRLGELEIAVERAHERISGLLEIMGEINAYRTILREDLAVVRIFENPDDSMNMMCGVIQITKSFLFEQVMKQSFKRNFVAHKNEVCGDKMCFVVITHGNAAAGKLAKIFVGLGGRQINLWDRARNRGRSVLELSALLSRVGRMADHVRRSLRTALLIASTSVPIWQFNVTRNILIFQTASQLHKLGSGLVAQFWVPSIHASEFVRIASTPTTVVTESKSEDLPPTFFEYSLVSTPFQMMNDMFEIPRYGEVNPALFHQFTFPFLFGCMFSDGFHGLLLLGIAALLFLVPKIRITDHSGPEIVIEGVDEDKLKQEVHKIIEVGVNDRNNTGISGDAGVNIDAKPIDTNYGFDNRVIDASVVGRETNIEDNRPTNDKIMGDRMVGKETNIEDNKHPNDKITGDRVAGNDMNRTERKAKPNQNQEANLINMESVMQDSELLDKKIGDEPVSERKKTTGDDFFVSSEEDAFYEKKAPLITRFIVFVSPFTQYRYLFLLCGLFSVYFGFLFNDFGSVSIRLFPSMFDSAPFYPFGVDWKWHHATNKDEFINKLKMKFSILIGFIHMTLGYIIDIVNCVVGKEYSRLIGETIPAFVIFIFFTGYLCLLVMLKYFNPNPNSVVEIIISMFTAPHEPIKHPFYRGQQYIRWVMAATIIILLFWSFLGGALLRKTKGDDKMMKWIESAVYTVELGVGLISNTTSYLRLWAVSLAHSTLTTIIHENLLAVNFPMNLLRLPLYFGCTILLLVGIEGISTALHACRLNWMEFNSKFLKGGGVEIVPLGYN